MEAEKLLLSVPKVARRMDLGRTTVYRLFWSGQLPSVRIGGSVRVPMDSLREWLRTKTQPHVG